MAKSNFRQGANQDSSDDEQLLNQLQQEEEVKLPLVSTGKLTMRDLVIYSALQTSMHNVAKTYIPKGRLASRREMVERAAVDAIMFADIFAAAYDKFEANKHA